MSGLRRTQPTSREFVCTEILPLSEGRPVQEPMLSPHPQQLWLLPVDQAPSSSRAVWLYQAGHIPPNIASIMGQQELDALLRVLNREVVEACIYMDAMLHTPKIAVEEGTTERQQRLTLRNGVSSAIAALLSGLFGPPVLTGILSALACELVVLWIGRTKRILLPSRTGAESIAIVLFVVAGILLVLLGVVIDGLDSAIMEGMVGAGSLLILWAPAYGITWCVSRCRQMEREHQVHRRVADEDPLSGLGPMLLGAPTTAVSGEGKEPGKYFRQEHRREALCAGRNTTHVAIDDANNRVLLAAHYVMHKAMAIYPGLRWTKGEVTRMVKRPDCSQAELSIPIIRVSEGYNSLVAERIASALRQLRRWNESVPFAAFVHHASQPDPETGETLVDDEMMHTRRQAFLALHGMEGMGHSPSEALPPMTGAVEEVVRRHQQPMSSAVASHAQAQPQAEGRGGGGYGGATSQFSPLASGADHAAKKKVAEDVGGGGGGAGGPSVV